MSLIRELKADTSIQGRYLCKYKQVLKNKNGKEYFSLKLQDYTGSVDGKIWSIHSGIESFEVNDVVEIQAEVILYQENLQLNIQKLRKLSYEEVDLKAFLPHTQKNLEDLQTRLMGLIDGISNPYLKKLLEKIFYDEGLYEKFLAHGAAKSVHHGYLGGLLEHTVTVAQIGLSMCQHYEPVNEDLVVAGCLLHDLGKLEELSAFPENDYTDEGQLIGHLVMGAERIHDMAKTIEDFPAEIELLLKHIILAHHGEYEFASPKRPKCLEAMIVHLADYSDAKIKMMEEMVKQSQTEGDYAGYHKILGRNIRKVHLKG